MSVNFLKGVALAKKKGNTIHVVTDPVGFGDETIVSAAGTGESKMLKDWMKDVKDLQSKQSDIGLSVVNGMVCQTFEE